MRQPHQPRPPAERSSCRLGREIEINKPVVCKNARKKLARLFASDPNGFEKKWQEKLGNYLEKVRKCADDGRWVRDLQGRQVLTFPVIDEALKVLELISVAAYAQYAKTTRDLLTYECCRLLGVDSTAPKLWHRLISERELYHGRDRS